LGGEDAGGGREGVRALDPAAQQRRRPTSTATPVTNTSSSPFFHPSLDFRL
jgi:hypothetical protein